MTLEDLIDQRLRELGAPGKPLSYRGAAERVEGISAETLRQLHRGQHHGRLEEDTIDGLAEAIRVPVDRVRRLLGRRRLHKFELPPTADRLTPKQRRAVLTMVSALLDPGEETPVASAEAGALIEAERRRRRISVGDAAIYAKVSVKEWNAIVAGQKPVDADTWIDVAVAARADLTNVFEALGLPVPDQVGDADYPEGQDEAG